MYVRTYLNVLVLYLCKNIFSGAMCVFGEKNLVEDGIVAAIFEWECSDGSAYCDAISALEKRSRGGTVEGTLAHGCCEQLGKTPPLPLLVFGAARGDRFLLTDKYFRCFVLPLLFLAKSDDSCRHFLALCQFHALLKMTVIGANVLTLCKSHGPVVFVCVI